MSAEESQNKQTYEQVVEQMTSQAADKAVDKLKAEREHEELIKMFHDAKNLFSEDEQKLFEQSQFMSYRGFKAMKDKDPSQLSKEELRLFLGYVHDLDNIVRAISVQQGINAEDDGNKQTQPVNKITNNIESINMDTHFKGVNPGKHQQAPMPQSEYINAFGEDLYEECSKFPANEEEIRACERKGIDPAKEWPEAVELVGGKPYVMTWNPGMENLKRDAEDIDNHKLVPGKATRTGIAADDINRWYNGRHTGKHAHDCQRNARVNGYLSAQDAVHEYINIHQ